MPETKDVTGEVKLHPSQDGPFDGGKLVPLGGQTTTPGTPPTGKPTIDQAKASAEALAIYAGMQKVLQDAAVTINSYIDSVTHEVLRADASVACKSTLNFCKSQISQLETHVNNAVKNLSGG